jgi:glycolate dehydrogenase iron-sulfur subunit
MAARAFDETRPPELDLIEDCVHCGFCLPTCPTYELWAEEMDSPRGRIVLMSTALEEGSELTPELVTHWDRCLGCMACVTACPSGVQYDKLIEDTRQQVERNFERPRRERAWRRFLFALFPHPGRLRALSPALVLGRRVGLERLAERSRLARFPRLRMLARLAPEEPLLSSLRRLPTRTAAEGERRGRVAFLQGCVQRVFFAGVNRATVRVLAAEGYDVVAPPRPRCCGALQLHSGFAEDAQERARETIAAFEGYDAVVVNAAGCGSAMKDYGHLFRDDPDWAERAEAFSAKVRDVTELLAAEPVAAPRHPIGLGAVAYHDACHLAHAQAIREEPRNLLRDIPGLELREPERWEICCGSAGVYNLLQPEAAAELGRRKAERLLATGARAVVAANPGCALQISAHARELGEELTVYHPIELLDASISGTDLVGANGRRAR